MRRGYNCSFIRDTHGEIFGINLGADFTAEHEWGIKGICRYFDISRELSHELDGFDGRKNNKFPNDKESSIELDGHGEMYILEQKNLYGIIFNYPKKYLDGLLKGELKIYNDDEYYRNRCSAVNNGIKEKDQKDLACAWDENSFAFVTTPTVERKAFVNKLFESFKNLSGVVMLGGRVFIENAGLVLLNYDKIPEDIKEEFRNKDIKAKKDQELYQKLEQKSGVFEALKKSNKTFFYLGIQSLDKNENPRWWLNPMEQQKYEANWYSTQDLLNWANNKGKVLKKKEGR